MIGERITREEMYLRMAHDCAMRSTCMRGNTGCVIVDVYDTVVSTGYNGAAKGHEDCQERGYCWRNENNVKSGEHYERCYAIHAEQNALIQAGKSSRCASMYMVSVNQDGDIECKLPCLLCSRMIVNANIAEVMIATDNNYEYRLFSPEHIYNMRHEEAGMW